MKTVPILKKNPHVWLLVFGILLIAANLRAPFTGLPPLLDLIGRDYTLSTIQLGLLTSLPLLAFAIISPFSSLFAREYGLERTLFIALICIAIGIGLRSLPYVACLYLGSWMIGSGIALGNVLLPSLVKRDFPHKVATLTGAYALVMGIAAAICSAIVMPISHVSSWQYALLSFLALPVLAMIFWIPQLKSQSKPAANTAIPLHGGSIWHSALAWQITLYLGLNSNIYYIAIGWLPSILTEAGLSAVEAGSQHGILQLSTAIPGLVLAPILYKMKDQSLAAATSCLFSAIALAGIMLLPKLIFIWAILFGIGTGAGIILGLTFIGLRTHNAHQAAALSGMSQCIGYLMAVIGPIAMGAIHDFYGNWMLSLTICIIIAIFTAGIGIFAGRDIQIS